MKAFDVEEFSQICLDIEKDQKGQGNYANALFISELRKMISTFPTVDAVPIIRCKDCINWDTDWTTHPPDHYCPAINQFTSANYYCGYSEKKDLEEQKCTSTDTQP